MYVHYLEKSSVDFISDEEVSEYKTVQKVSEIFTVQYEIFT